MNTSKQKKPEVNHKKNDDSMIYAVILIFLFSGFLLVFLRDRDTQGMLMKDIISGTQTAMSTILKEETIQANDNENLATPNNEVVSTPLPNVEVSESISEPVSENSTIDVDSISEGILNGQLLEYKISVLEDQIQLNRETANTSMDIKFENINKEIHSINEMIIATNKRIDALFLFIAGTFITLVIATLTLAIKSNKIDKKND